MKRQPPTQPTDQIKKRVLNLIHNKSHVDVLDIATRLEMSLEMANSICVELLREGKIVAGSIKEK